MGQSPKWLLWGCLKSSSSRLQSRSCCDLFPLTLTMLLLCKLSLFLLGVSFALPRRLAASFIPFLRHRSVHNNYYMMMVVGEILGMYDLLAQERSAGRESATVNIFVT